MERERKYKTHTYIDMTAYHTCASVYHVVYIFNVVVCCDVYTYIYMHISIRICLYLYIRGTYLIIDCIILSSLWFTI